LAVFAVVSWAFPQWSGLALDSCPVAPSIVDSRAPVEEFSAVADFAAFFQK